MFSFYFFFRPHFVMYCTQTIILARILQHCYFCKFITYLLTIIIIIIIGCLTYVLAVVIAVIFSARRVITNDQRLKTAAMEPFCKNGQRLLALNYAVKKGFVVDVRVGSEYATGMSFSWFYLMVSCYNFLLVIPCCEQDTIIFLLLQKRLSIKL